MQFKIPKEFQNKSENFGRIAKQFPKKFPNNSDSRL